jgi:hypothetical protein
MATLKIVSSFVLLTASALALRGAIGGGGDAPLDPPPPVNTEFAGVLLRSGLGADTLAAAGVTSEQVAGLAGAVRTGYSAATLQSRDEAFIAAKQDHDRLRRLVQSGKGTAQDLVALRAAEVTLASATAARDTYLATLRSAGLATLSAGQAALITRIDANRSWSLPTQYLVKDRSEADWVALRAALAAKRISEQDPEEECAQSARDALAAADAVSEVATAKVNLDTHLAGVQTAWNLAAAD